MPGLVGAGYILVELVSSVKKWDEMFIQGKNVVFLNLEKLMLIRADTSLSMSNIICSSVIFPM